MNGRESVVGTMRAYQAYAAKVNQNRYRLRCTKKDLWICFHRKIQRTPTGRLACESGSPDASRHLQRIDPERAAPNVSGRERIPPIRPATICG
jgi:hypothetical protein